MVTAGIVAWLLRTRSWKLETGNWKLETGSLTAGNETDSQQPAFSNQLSVTSNQLLATSFQRSAATLVPAVAFFLLPLVPLILFNLRTGGTLASIFGNLGHSYYGVDNAAYLPNLLTRLGQIRTLLRGDHFWYLGGIYANEPAPWVAGGLVVAGLGAWVYRRISESANRRIGESANQRISESANRRMGEWANRRGTQHATSNKQQVVSAPFLPIALLLLIVAQSAFTVSDLFITHYVLVLPLIPLAGGLAVGSLMQEAEGRRPNGRPTQSLDGKGQEARGKGSSFRILTSAFILLTSTFLVLWAGGDLWTTVRYHRALAAMGGHAAHSDAVADLAAYLERGGLWAPVTLDWGIDASVRFLTAGRINPIEVFGYARLDAPDDGFAARVSGFLDNPDNVYLAHAPEATVFRGRVEAVSRLAAERGLALREEIRFNERSGRPLFVVYRAEKKQLW
jgi:hypothetical protein